MAVVRIAGRTEREPIAPSRLLAVADRYDLPSRILAFSLAQAQAAQQSVEPDAE